MIHTIIFSKNRPAQLDQLLQSINLRAPNLGPIEVLWTATVADYFRGYELCKSYFPQVQFTNEHSFESQVTDTLHRSTLRYVMFLVDDDIFTRPLRLDPSPGLLLESKTTLCVSLRLGLNTTECYPLRRSQRTPAFIAEIGDAHVWNWRAADGDWGYPGSLDGHIFRREQIVGMLARQTYTNPNRLEEALVHACETQPQSLMACYSQSALTGCPLNRVNTTHILNRNGELNPQDPGTLNTAYITGKRPMLSTPPEINAAHVELPLVFA